ncbi:NACHT domain-containing protein [Tahibacter harae]|uniref:NACHT domain-containing protein n=1 Tax=Tahibacter harae TaxID=2963937 RepID=A0ABT1QMI1_9GAMM|nr:NACHT domain-containing protein [Tahibacter harae]MCQ4163741.1 hypothetical protein [Tahibacter harae]
MVLGCASDSVLGGVQLQQADSDTPPASAEKAPGISGQAAAEETGSDAATAGSPAPETAVNGAGSPVGELSAPADAKTVSMPRPRLGEVMASVAPNGAAPFRPALLELSEIAGVQIAANALAADDAGERAVIGTRNGQIASTSDGGRRWLRRWIGGRPFVAATYSAAVKRFLLADDEGGIYLSDDGGMTWALEKALPDPDVIRLVANRGGGVLAIMASGRVFRTAGGSYSSWTLVREGDGGRFVDVCFVPRSAVALAVDDSSELWRSADDGATWSRHPTRYALGLRSIACGENSVVAVGRANGYGETLMRIGKGRSTLYTNGLRWEASTGNILVEQLSGIVVLSDDGGASWMVAAEPTFALNRVSYDYRRQRYFAAGAGGYLLSDGSDAKVWNTFATPDLTSFIDVALRGPAGEALALDDQGFLYDAKDGGLNWARMEATAPGSNRLLTLRDATVVPGNQVGLVTESAAVVPAVTGIKSQRQIGNDLVIDFELDDPSGLCTGNCVEVAGWSSADYARRAKIAPRPINSDAISRSAVNTVRVVLDPAATLSAVENSTIYLVVTLSGPGFRVRYPSSDQAFALVYKPDWRSIAAAASLALLLLVLGMVFWLRPFWVISLACSAEKVAEMVGVPFLQSVIKSLFPLLFALPFSRRRVLAAWLRAHRHKFLARLELDGPQQYEYVPLPLGMRHGAGAPVSAAGVTVDALRHVKGRPFAAMVISGNGGTGKSTLAGRIARLVADESALGNPSLPLWFSADSAMPERMYERVREIAGQPLLPAAIIGHLARDRFLLFIVDGVSEAPADFQKAWQEFAKQGNFVVLTTRREEAFANRDYTYCRTSDLGTHEATVLLIDTVASLLRSGGVARPAGEVLNIQGGMLTAFSGMFPGAGAVSPLLVRLFVENYLAKAITAVAANAGAPAITASEVQVYFDYLAELHRRKPSGDSQLDSEALLFKACKALAVRELAEDYLPKAVKHDAGIAALSRALGDDARLAAALLQRLKEDGILRMYNVEGDVMWRFEFDPIAEHVAALALVELDARRMRRLAEGLSQQSDPPQGFIRAVRAILSS